MWCGRRVRRMLEDPRYTGYQVWNRRTRERANPISEWVWSRQQAHPAIVTSEEWHATQKMTVRIRQRRRSGWERVQAAADELGLTLTRTSTTDEHVLLEVNGRQIVVPRGELPPTAADELVDFVQASR